MNDLEDRLRTMLRDRASDVTQVPAHVLPAPEPPAQRRWRTGWLVAAAVAVVLAVAAIVVGTGGEPRSSAPADHRTPTVSSPPPVDHSVAKVRLAWFGMAAVPGFDRHAWISDIGRRTLALRARADQDMPVGCNGCALTTDFVTVFEQHVFDAAKYHVSSWPATTINGRPARLGSMQWYGERQPLTVPTIAWQYGPDQWAIVQGVTTLGGKSATLRKVARAVRPTVDVPIGLPFRLDRGPNMPLVQIIDDRAEGYSLSLQFDNGPDVSFSITLTPGTRYAGHYDTSTATPRSVGGLPGYVDAEQGIGVLYHDGIAVLGFGGTSPDTNRAALEAIAAGIHWTNGDGRAPYLSVERAIP